jgi:hypothetical protein
MSVCPLHSVDVSVCGDAYLTDLFTRIANGHLAEDINALMTWT